MSRYYLILSVSDGGLVLSRCEGGGLSLSGKRCNSATDCDRGVGIHKEYVLDCVDWGFLELLVDVVA